MVVLTARSTSTTGSTACAAAPTTTSPSRSARPSWCCGCRRCCTAPAVGRDRAAATFGGGRLRIDEARHEASLDGQPLELTPTEWGLLTALAGTPGRVFSRYELVNRVRGYEFAGYERTIDSHVKNLRHKLGPDGTDIVETVLGVGYRLGWSRDR